VGNETLLAELETYHAPEPVAIEQPSSFDRSFVLIGRRENGVINSTGRNLSGLMRGHPQPRIRTSDRPRRAWSHLGRRGRDPFGARQRRGRRRATQTCAAGVIAMSHRFGSNPGEAEDPHVDGANTNRLFRTDVDEDPITGMPRMGALPVSLTPLRT
jgi:hypothetical protein